MSLFKRILIVLLLILVFLQFIRPAKNIHPGIQAETITSKYPAGAQVQNILYKACYDCHSNNTRYPWYNQIQPIAWWLNSHVEEGKQNLNFDEFLNYPPKKQAKKIEKVIEQLKEGGMPLDSYTWIHTDAKLTPIEKQLLIDWADSIKKTFNPASVSPSIKPNL